MFARICARTLWKLNRKRVIQAVAVGTGLGYVQRKTVCEAHKSGMSRHQVVVIYERSSGQVVETGVIIDTQGHFLCRSCNLDLTQPEAYCVKEGGSEEEASFRLESTLDGLFIGRVEKRNRLSQDSHPLEISPETLSQDGSVLLDSRGRLLGLLQQSGQVLPGTQIAHLARQFNSSGQVSRPYLGVSLKQYQGQLLVINISSSSPAEKAGLRLGDTLLQVNHQPVGDIRQFFLALGYDLSAPISLTVLRDDVTSSIRIDQ